MSKNWNKKIWFTRCPVANASEIAISKGFLRKEGFIKNDFSINKWADRSFIDDALAQ